MSTQFPKNSMGEQAAKSKKVAAVIIILGFILLHVLAYTLSASPNFSGWRIALTAVAFVAAVVVAVSLWKDGSLVEEQKWPYILVVVLAFTSAVCIGYCASC